MRARYPYTMFFLSIRVEHVDAQNLRRGEDILGQFAGLGPFFNQADSRLELIFELPNNFAPPPNDETYLSPPNHQDNQTATANRMFEVYFFQPSAFLRYLK